MFLGGKSWRVYLCLILLAATGLLLVSTPANAAINSEINFQGKLTNPNGTNVTDGNYSLRFRIYNHVSNDAAAACAANSCLWEETQGSVAVDDGIFRVALGSSTSLSAVDFNTAPLYLGVKVGADAEMTPRITFTATPYAINSDFLDGLSSSAFGQLTAASQTWTGTNTFQPTTNITSAIVRQSSFGSPTADIFNLQTANSTNILQVTGPAANEAAVTLRSVGATRALTLDSGSGTIVVGTTTTTLQKVGTSLTVDLNSASASTVTITNAAAGVASLSVEGNITTSATIGTVGTTTFTGAGGTFSGVVAANGGITFDAATDTVGAHTLSGTIDASTNIITNLGNAGTDFVAGTGALNLAGLLTANAGVTLGTNQDLTTTAGTGTITVNSTVSNASDDAISVVPSFTGGATDALTYNAMAIGAFAPTNAAGTDIVDGLNIGNMTDPGATITSTAIDIGSGWDTGLRFNDTTPTIRLGATDNTGILSVVDVNSNVLMKIQDHSTNFGASVEAGAFIGYNSMYVDEFFKDRAQVAADGNQNWGDNTEWSTGETGTCTWDGVADAVNGVTSIVANAAASTCTLAHNDLGAATANLWLDADNLPTILMKVRPSVAGAGVPDTDHQFFAGMSDGGFGAAPASGAPTNGIYFSNASNTAGTTGTANWYAVTDNGGASTNTACGVAVSETTFALLMIKVMSTSMVRFYIDGDVSNGVNMVECGTGNTTNINTAGMTTFLKSDWDVNANASTLETDFYRVWQDDAATGQQAASPTVSEAGQITGASTGGSEETLGASESKPVTEVVASTSAAPKDKLNTTTIAFSALAALAFAILLYRNYATQKELKRVSSPAYIASVIRPMVKNRNANRRKIQ